MDTADVLRDIAIVLGVGLVAEPVAEVLRLPRMVAAAGRGHRPRPRRAGLVEIPFDSIGAQLSSRSASR